MTPEEHAEQAAPYERVYKCENCETILGEDRLDCHCDDEGLWFCPECWQVLLEGDATPEPDSDEMDRRREAESP